MPVGAVQFIAEMPHRRQKQRDARLVTRHMTALARGLDHHHLAASGASRLQRRVAQPELVAQHQREVASADPGLRMVAPAHRRPVAVSCVAHDGPRCGNGRCNSGPNPSCAPSFCARSSEDHMIHRVFGAGRPCFHGDSWRVWAVSGPSGVWGGAIVEIFITNPCKFELTGHNLTNWFLYPTDPGSHSSPPCKHRTPSAVAAMPSNGSAGHARCVVCAPPDRRHCLRCEAIRRLRARMPP